MRTRALFAANFVASLLTFGTAVCAGAQDVPAQAPTSSTLTSPEGYYVNFDDRTDAPRGLIELVRNDAGELEGYIRGSFIEGEDPRRVCDECEDELEGATLLNLRILHSLRPHDGDVLDWRKGRITDPDNGETYKAKMAFEPDFSEVKVRGYIGSPILGRSQYWKRASAEDIALVNTYAAQHGVAPIAMPLDLME